MLRLFLRRCGSGSFIGCFLFRQVCGIGNNRLEYKPVFSGGAHKPDLFPVPPCLCNIGFKNIERFGNGSVCNVRFGLAAFCKTVKINLNVGCIGVYHIFIYKFNRNGNAHLPVRESCHINTSLL